MIHTHLTQKKWDALGKTAQILNIASELTRAKNWIEKENNGYAGQSITRTLELIDLTVQCYVEQREYAPLREILLLREAVANLYVRGNDLRDTPENLLKAVLAFDATSAMVKV